MNDLAPLRRVGGRAGRNSQAQPRDSGQATKLDSNCSTSRRKKLGSCVLVTYDRREVRPS
ncbi:hypothetical protein K469DRAFT_710913, partial [Zopfia rhizophila CBS 207.26]